MRCKKAQRRSLWEWKLGGKNSQTKHCHLFSLQTQHIFAEITETPWSPAFFYNLLVVESHFKSLCKSMTQLTLHYMRRFPLCCIWQKNLTFLMHFIHHPFQIKKRKCDIKSFCLKGTWLNVYLSNHQLCQLGILKILEIR